jgi:hypothetical protein
MLIGPGRLDEGGAARFAAPGDLPGAVVAQALAERGVHDASQEESVYRRSYSARHPRQRLLRHPKVSVTPINARRDDVWETGPDSIELLWQTRCRSIRRETANYARA